MDGRGQAELVGVVLLIGLTILGTTAIVVLGTGTIADSRTDSEIQSTEHAMTLFDSKAANVALGESSVQTVQFGRTGGQFAVQEDVGTMRVEHRTEDGTAEIGTTTLGALVYTHGETELAYQGGGVWRHQNGGTTMVSPPEFHYRGETLTLPIVTMAGEGSASGGPTATVRSETERPESVYTGEIDEGTISVTVESPYYQGWQQHFEERTNGNVSVDHETESVTVELISPEMQGEFSLTSSDNTIKLRGIPDEEPIDRFEFTLYPYEGDASGFNNLDWRLEDENSDLKLEFTDGQRNEIDLTVISPNGTETTFDGAFEIDDAEERIDVDLMARDVTADDSDEALGDVINRHLAEVGPTVDFEVHDQGQGSDNRISYQNSTGHLEYDGDGQFIAYLHITENSVNVRLS